MESYGKRQLSCQSPGTYEVHVIAGLGRRHGSLDAQCTSIPKTNLTAVGGVTVLIYRCALRMPAASVAKQRHAASCELSCSSMEHRRVRRRLSSMLSLAIEYPVGHKARCLNGKQTFSTCISDFGVGRLSMLKPRNSSGYGSNHETQSRRRIF